VVEAFILLVDEGGFGDWFDDLDLGFDWFCTVGREEVKKREDWRS
jgi:hypothetical protein